MAVRSEKTVVCWESEQTIEIARREPWRAAISHSGMCSVWFGQTTSRRLSADVQRQTGHHWRRPGLPWLKTGTAKPLGDFGGCPSAGLAEEPEEQIHQAANLSNLAGAICRSGSQMATMPPGRSACVTRRMSSRFVASSK